MKYILLALSLLLTTHSANAVNVDTSLNPTVVKKTYGLHLFFNEQEFVDVLTIEEGMCVLQGHMSVPNDFEGDIENIVKVGNKLEFDLLVPKNAARPNDMIFHYSGTFFDSDEKQLIGYVTLKDDSKFIASFTAFQR